jgi:DNA-binding LacI/PurR family transcriptional regulator
MVVPSLSHPYLISIMSGIARQANQAGCALQVISSFENAAEERRQLENAAVRALDGMIVYPRHIETNLASYRAISLEKPVVMIDRYLPELQTDRVLFQDELAGFELTELLIQKGHRRIAWVSHEAPATSVQNRLVGHRRALQARGIPLDEDLMWLDLFPRQKLVSETPLMSLDLRKRLFQRIFATGTTLLLAANYDIALRLANCVLSGSFEHLQASARSFEAGGELRSRELAIAAFSHETSFAQPLFCPTYAYQSGEELGKRAASLLFERIQNPSLQPRSVEIPMQIVDPACDGMRPVRIPFLTQDHG